MKIFLTPNPNPPHNLMTRFPAYSDDARPGGMTDDEFLQFAINRSKAVGDIAEDATIYIVDDSELPSDPYFFDAWEWSD